MQNENKEADLLIERITTKLRSKKPEQTSKAFDDGWGCEAPTQEMIDAVAQNGASEVLHEINLMEEREARIHEQITAAVNDVNEGIALYFSGIDEEFKARNLNSQNSSNHTPKGWREYNPRTHSKTEDTDNA